MVDIEINFKGPFLTIKGPEMWIKFIKEHIKEVLDDFADVCNMPLQKSCQKLIEDRTSQEEFKFLIYLLSITH